MPSPQGEQHVEGSREQTKDRFFVKWRSNRTGSSGYTEFKFSDKEAAFTKAAELDKSEPDYGHFVQERTGDGKYADIS